MLKANLTKQIMTIFLQEVVHFCPQRLQDCSFIFCRRFLFFFSPLGSSSPASAGFGWASFATTENSIKIVLKSKKNMELIILQVIYTHYNYLMSKIFLQLKEGNNFGTET